MESLNTTPVIQIKNINASYGEKTAVKDLSCDIFPNRITAIIGSSGCGKSTLLSCINETFLLNEGAKRDGEIKLNGDDIRSMPVETLRRRIGLVAQEPLPFPFSVQKNITYSLVYHGAKRGKQMTDKCIDVLRKVALYDEIGGNLNHKAQSLSGGQKQRLCIARALAVEPEVLLLDEPCSALDVASTRQIEDVLVSLKTSMTIMLVTHNLAQAKRIADDVICMKEGRLVKCGLATEIFKDDPDSEAFLEKLYE